MPKIVTKSVLARELGLSKPRISQLISMGLPVLPDNRVDLATAKRWFADNVQPIDTSVSTAYSEARRVHAIYRAKLRRWEYEQRQSTLIETDAVRERLKENLAAIEAGMAAMVDRLAQVLAAETDAKQVHRLFRDELIATLTVLADQIGGKNGAVPQN